MITEPVLKVEAAAWRSLLLSLSVKVNMQRIQGARKWKFDQLCGHTTSQYSLTSANYYIFSPFQSGGETPDLHRDRSAHRGVPVLDVRCV